MSRECVFLDDKTGEKVARYQAHLSLSLALLSNRRSAAFLFLGTVKTVITKVTSTKRRDIFVECPRAGRYPSFIFVTAIRRRL